MRGRVRFWDLASLHEKMTETAILDECGQILARVWSDRPIDLHTGDTIGVDGSTRSILRVDRGGVHTRPAPPEGMLTDFLRYHVLFRVFDGDVRRWRRALGDAGADASFLAWLERRIDREPAILDELREMVESSGLWPAE